MTNDDHNHKRGKIVDNKLAALVTSELFKTRVVENKKRYKRKKIRLDDLAKE